MSKRKSLFFSLFVIFFITGFLFKLSFVSAATGLKDTGNYGIDIVAKAAELDSKVTLATRIGNIIGAVMAFVGILFFALMIYGGITWMTASGNQEDEKQALNTIVAAVIGIVIVLSSYMLVNFVFNII